MGGQFVPAFGMKWPTNVHYAQTLSNVGKLVTVGQTASFLLKTVAKRKQFRKYSERKIRKSAS